MNIDLFGHQYKAVFDLRNGAILRGGVGSGKSRTALVYFYTQVAKGQLVINGIGESKPITESIDLYIITTARKRDDLEWDAECSNLSLARKKNVGIPEVNVFIDSWNNIQKYIDVKNAFFIFDEQRAIGSGSWSKSFIKIAKNNKWIMLSATPGDVWMDYVPMFIANGYYKNRTEFIREHVIYNRFTKFPSIDRYIGTQKLQRYKESITIYMNNKKQNLMTHTDIIVDYDKEMYDIVSKKRWDVFKEEPIKDAGSLCYVLRHVVNGSDSRVASIKHLMNKHKKSIIFYNFIYELELLRAAAESLSVVYAEWNGQKHESIPTDEEWVYLVQYTAGAEGWNCIDTNVIIFYSQNYSYKIMIQAAGRIDRLNTPFDHLQYYYLKTESTIDQAIAKALKQKKNFNQKQFLQY